VGDARARPALPLVYLIGFISAGAFTLLQFLVPLWSQALGAPPLTVGIIAGAGSLLPSLFMVPVGALIDQRGARQVLAVAAVLAALSAALMPLAPGYWWLVPVQIAGGLGRTAAWVAAQAYLIQVTPSSELTRRTSSFSFTTSSGTFLFPIVGGFLVDLAGHGVAFGLGAVAYAVLLLALRPLPPLAPAGSAAPWSLWQAYRRAGAMLLRAGVLLVMWGTIVRLALASIRTSFLPLYLLDLAFSPGAIGALIGLGNLSGVLATPATARLQAALGAGSVLFLALGASAAAMWGTPYFRDLFALGLLGLIWGMGIGMALPPLLTLIARQTLPAERGLGVALRNTGNEWSIMLSPIGFGLVAEPLGLGPAFMGVGAALVLASAVGLPWSRKLRT
jgi:MFS family permease